MLLWLAALAATTSVTRTVSGTAVAILAVGAEGVRALLGTTAVASHVRYLPHISVPAGIAGRGISVLGGVRTTGPSFRRI